LAKPEIFVESDPLFDDVIMEETFNRFYSKLSEYNPRKYVEENLSYKQSVKTLMEIFDAA